MAKKILFESAVHQFLSAARDLSREPELLKEDSENQWAEFVSSMSFKYLGPGSLQVSWTKPEKGDSVIDTKKAKFYYRGDQEKYYKIQEDEGMLFQSDPIQDYNRDFYINSVVQVAADAGIPLNREKLKLDSSSTKSKDENRFEVEEQFHDGWAAAEDMADIDVILMNEACTAPEMRFITKELGDLEGKTLLDLGCGLGEASVYFAMKGADVTAVDISQGMLDATLKLAELNGVSVNTYKSAAEFMKFDESKKFDYVYAGNLFHHVDIETTVRDIVNYIKPTGKLLSWDPVAYNPVINIYRKRAKDTRTKDEHPFTLKDLRIFKKYFGDVKLNWFWLTTLTLFIIMAVVQRRNPNKERYWKVIVEEGPRWAWLYWPLEKLDKVLLSILPFLRPLCWNVVVTASNPIYISNESFASGSENG